MVSGGSRRARRSRRHREASGDRGSAPGGSRHALHREEPDGVEAVADPPLQKAGDCELEAAGGVFDAGEMRGVGDSGKRTGGRAAALRCSR